MPPPRVADMSSRDFHEMVSDPDIFVGGGSAAAITAAAAGSTALLVMQLNARRKALVNRRPAIERAILDVRQAIEACHHAADEDIAILAELLDAHREFRASRDEDRYLWALAAAAESPLRIAALAVEMLEVFASQLEISTRFTVSDLGAAAVLAGGACQAALLTAEVNIALLGENERADRESVLSMEEARARMHSHATGLSESIERETRNRLHAGTGRNLS